jgi:hypothetical protein
MVELERIINWWKEVEMTIFKVLSCYWSEEIEESQEEHKQNS